MNFTITSRFVPASAEGVFRMYNKSSNEHLWTTDTNEVNTLVNSHGWLDEGIDWSSPTKSSSPVYRVFNSKSGEHVFTRDTNEVNTLVKKNGWTDEGIKFYSDDAKGRPIYRVWLDVPIIGAHFVTSSSQEVSGLVAQGYKREGVAWYGMQFMG